MESISEVLKEPIVPFAVLLVVILTVPILFERLRLPGLVGLLAAGVILGENGLRLLKSDLPTMELLSDIGLVYLMFVAGLEVDMEQFRRKADRSIGFGVFTFLIPLLVGTFVGRVFGFGWNASILMGSLFASHTLLAYPLVSQMGLAANEAVMVTIGATIFTDIGALLVLAICVAIHAGEFSLIKLLTLLGSLIVYSAVVLFGFDRAGREFFRRTGEDQGNQFLFILLAVFLSAVGAQLIGVEKIVGAFLAGLAVNDVVGEGPVKEKVLFVGNVLFIPIFFVDLGLLVDVPAFLKTLGTIWLTLAIVVGLIASKFAAAFATRLLYRYSWIEMLTMWSLSMPQVGATLAATLVGYKAGLLTEGVLNSVIVLMLVTATLGPVLTSRFAKDLSPMEERGIVENPIEAEPATAPTIIVPLSNPQTERYLLEMAALLSPSEEGRIVPLAIATPYAHMDSPEQEQAIAKGEMLLTKAMELSQELGIKAQPLLRIEDNVAAGIVRTSREQNANLIVMGWSRQRLRSRLFGNVIDSVFWSTHCPVAVTRLLSSPQDIRRILVPISNLSPQAMQPLRFAQRLATTGAKITVLNVCDRRTTDSKIAWMRSQLSLIFHHSEETEIEILRHDNVAAAILATSAAYDLVILRSQRRVTSGSLTISDVTTELVHRLTTSVVMLGEPERRSNRLISSNSNQRLKKSSKDGNNSELIG